MSHLIVNQTTRKYMISFHHFKVQYFFYLFTLNLNCKLTLATCRFYSSNAQTIAGKFAHKIMTVPGQYLT